MSKLPKSLARMHPQIRNLVSSALRVRSEPLYSNDHNRQMLTYCKIFRQTADAMLHDGGPDIAEEMMKSVIAEMRARRSSDARGNQAGMGADPNLNLEGTGWFMEM